MSRGTDKDSAPLGVGSGTERVVGLATALHGALRTVSMYPATHPRVASAVDTFLAVLKKYQDGDRWLTLRLRGTQLGVGEDWVEADNPQLVWLCDRMRAASLCGIEFGPACSGADLVEFAGVIAPTSARSGPAPIASWPSDHPNLRTLDLVFTGHHREGVEADSTLTLGRSATLRSSSADSRRNRLIACLVESEALQQRLRSIEGSCGGLVLEEEVEVDVLATIADLLPAEITSDAATTVEITTQILDRVYAELMQGVRLDVKVDSSKLISTAIEVAKRFMTSEAPQVVQRHQLPVGRPEDQRIEASLDLLLDEYAALPDCSGGLFAATDAAVAASALNVELLGIHLHTLAQAKPTEVAATLADNLTTLLDAVDADRLAVLDAYLLPETPGNPTKVGDEVTLRMLAVLTRIGKRPLIQQRGYCPPALVRRAFPTSLPIATRILGGTPRGHSSLSEALILLGPTLKSGGVADAVASGVLADTDVLRTLVAVGGEPPLPLLAAAAASAHGEALALLFDYARTLRLPPGAAAVLRWMKPDDVPAHYLGKLLQAASARDFDRKLEELSGTVLREFIERRRSSLPLEHVLGAIDSLREVPSAATKEFLVRLAMEGRFTRWFAADRAVRRQARRLLAIPELFASESR